MSAEKGAAIDQGLGANDADRTQLRLSIPNVRIGHPVVRRHGIHKLDAAPVWRRLWQIGFDIDDERQTGIRGESDPFVSGSFSDQFPIHGDRFLRSDVNRGPRLHDQCHIGRNDQVIAHMNRAL